MVQPQFKNRAKTAVSHKVSSSHELLVRGCILWAEVIKTPLSESEVCGTAGSERGFYEQNMLCVMEKTVCFVA